MKVLRVSPGETDRGGKVFTGRIAKSWEDWTEGKAGEGEEDDQG